MLRRLAERLRRCDLAMTVVRWFDAEAGLERLQAADKLGVDWIRCLPFLGLHLACLAVLWVGWSPVAVGAAAVLYAARMFAITGFYHRYFSHRSFAAGRPVQLAFAILGASAAQRGPLWWAAHHRHHHRFADTPSDAHSPAQHGFVWSHIGWFMTRENFPTRWEYVRDWAAFPELRWINRFDIVVVYALAGATLALGALLGAYAPALGTSGPQMLVWGFVVSTVACFHATFTINSLDHMIGLRRYETPDTSRNNAVLAVLTLGEGWHNNHHYYPIAARQGFFWWQIDVTYYLLAVLGWLGIVRDLRGIPETVRRPVPAEDARP